MKFSLHPFLVSFSALLLFLIILMVWQKHEGTSAKNSNSHLSLFLPDFYAPRIQNLISLKKKKSGLSCHSLPASLYKLSHEELRYYPQAFVLEAREIEGSKPHQKIYIRILKTDSKSHSDSSELIRTEEIVDDQTGKLMGRKEMGADHLLVHLPKGEDPYYFLQRLGTTASAIHKITEDGSLYNLTLRSGSLEAIPQGLEKIATMGGDVFAEPDYILHGCGAPSPNLSFYDCFSTFNIDNQWGLWGTCGGINVYEAWQVEPSAPSVIVAVIDSGIRATHEDLAENMWCDSAHPPTENIHGIDTLGHNADPGDLNHHGHGTPIAGIIGGAGLGLNGGVFGVSPKIQLMSCCCMDKDKNVNEEGLQSCLNYAINHGASIINCSLATNPGGEFSSSTYNIFQKMHDKGIIVVTVAGSAEEVITKDAQGNDVTSFHQNNNDDTCIYPANYKFDNIISVASSGYSNPFFSCELSPKSNYGAKTVHIAAPGCNILSASNDCDNTYDFFNGTSMSAPFVSGALALLKQHYPQATYKDLIRHLLETADHNPNLQGKIIEGRKLNVGRALQTPLVYSFR